MYILGETRNEWIGQRPYQPRYTSVTQCTVTNEPLQSPLRPAAGRTASWLSLLPMLIHESEQLEGSTEADPLRIVPLSPTVDRHAVLSIALTKHFCRGEEILNEDI